MVTYLEAQIHNPLWMLSCKTLKEADTHASQLSLTTVD